MAQDDFFTKKSCDRCGGSLKHGRTMSVFNTDCICLACRDKERERLDYQMAHDAEVAAVKRGDYNFKGIGFKK